ncbi:MAG: hypothetical protein C5B43_01215 [Verrucomicrobia bacterium]|nr:MAG: hypothetical protein C5B43_01215 [Verrucomicrobiota bacterium]
MTDSNYVYEKGTIFVAPGGGAAPTPLSPGAANQALFANPDSDLGVEWGVGSAMGNVVGPISSTAHHLASFADTTGELLEDSGIAKAAVALGPMSSTAHHLAAFSGTDGVTLEDSGVLTANVVQGPASTVDNTVPRFDTTSGKLLQSSPVTMADTTGAMTFPSGGGTILTAGAGSAERKGSFTFNGSGTHTKILTTAAVTGCVIVYTVVSLGTVTTAQAILTTIDSGVGFTPVSADGTDSSVVNWAIVA